MPKDILERMQTELSKVVMQPEIQTKLGELGLTPYFMAGIEYTRFIANEIRRWGPVIRAAGVKGG